MKSDTLSKKRKTVVAKERHTLTQNKSTKGNNFDLKQKKEGITYRRILFFISWSVIGSGASHIVCRNRKERNKRIAYKKGARRSDFDWRALPDLFVRPK
ncbi:hypothetical protein OUZ56_002339 [Daphnia magna]|uniref:Uncharacterized protein n=1 Tax=Daphnia magna TaxID=35525 RepID=A0ABR0A5D7_9CRUS|nr:hypothetical protein OUZ56_002339 [Daphnia magna]